MRRFLMLIVLSSLAFAPAPVYRPRSDPRAADLKALQGVWVVAYFIGNGERMPSTQEATWRIEGANVTTTFGGKPSSRFTLVLGEAGVPRHLDLVKDDGERMPGRYQVEGDRLEVGIGKERPGDLSGRGEGVGVWILQRKKP